MKKYYSIAFLLLSAYVFAQQAVSFEFNEGFNVGNIHGQAGWISTPTGGVPANVTHQTISVDKASDGSSSLKIVKESTYGTQSDPIIGGFYNLSAPLAYNNFSVSFDINISQLNGSDFGFQGVNNVDDQFVVRLDFDKTGLFKILNTVSGIPDLISIPSAWLPNIWYRVKVIGTGTDIRYYLNNHLIYTGTAAGSMNIDQLRFVHNNALGSAYIDNIKVNSELLSLGVEDSRAATKQVSIYPNPATDFIHINSLGTVKSIEIYDEAGKLIKTEKNNNRMDVKGLSAGVYMINIKTEGRNFTEKVIIR
ncbi:T9SS type A sorting domain-containing protein [Chryseobacterium sp. JV558]|uniref:T9SS type A sorting domain-containing protein n=1 Tax=Chryseobacterium sp. JV558 TaxID=2663236 RepID=UPI00299E8359|nr:T9SS type A sorting domain-containing protein [Chryseobacterium sp. JV558]MDW9378999.1 T9SS type A sorting domain-containing protein [Chryseobacterium sp. JV558]